MQFIRSREISSSFCYWEFKWTLLFFPKCSSCIHCVGNTNFCKSIFNFTDSFFCQLRFSTEPVQWIIYFKYCTFSSEISNWKNCFYVSAEDFYLLFISCMLHLTSYNTVILAVLHSLIEKFWHLELFPDCCFSWKLVTFF